MASESFSSQELSCTATKIHISEQTGTLIVWVSTWDGKLQSFRFNSKFSQLQKLAKFDITTSPLAPVLGLTAMDNKVYYACDDEEERSVIYERDVHQEKSEPTIIGSRSKPINHLLSLDPNTLCAFSWDKTCTIWDLRQDGKKSNPTHIHKLPSSVLDVKRHKDTIMGVLKDDKLFKMNAENPEDDPEIFGLLTDSHKRSYLSCLAINPHLSDRDDFAVGTLEGKVMHCSLEPPSKDAEAHGIYKSHVYKDIYFPVNSLTYHSTCDNFVATGGRDGQVNFHQEIPLSKYSDLFTDSMPVTHIDVSESGNYLVIAKGNGWHPDPAKIISHTKEKPAKIIVYSFVENDFIG